MKKKLSTLTFFMLLAIVSVTAQCCNSSAQKSDNNQSESAAVAESSDVEVYYFHATRRCFTCNAVEEAAQNAIVELYGEDVPFAAVNWQEEKEHPIIKENNIHGQSLLITNGEKAVDITGFAFMNARNPEKLKNKIKETVESL